MIECDVPRGQYRVEHASNIATLCIVLGRVRSDVLFTCGNGERTARGKQKGKFRFGFLGAGGNYGEWLM